MKQLLSFLMLLVSVTASAQEFTYTYEGQTLNYRVVSNTNWAKTCIVAENSSLEGALVIPEKVLYENSEYSVSYIGKMAFKNCSGLTSIDIPNSVTFIGENSFDGCNGLTEVNIHDIAEWCKIDFYNYDSNPIYYAKTLKLNGEEVKKLVIPSSVTAIKMFMFSGCNGLTSVDIPTSVTKIGEGAFRGCTGLTSIVIPAHVTSIGQSAFWGCNGLTSVDIPSSVIAIGESAFQGCSGLTSVEIPNSVTSIGRYAFYNCSGLTEVNIHDIAAWCNVRLNGPRSNPMEYVKGFKLNGEEVTNLIIPSSVTSIGDYAFYGCSNLTSVDIPNSVTAIGKEAFHGCSGLTSIEIPNSVTSIGDYAFCGCRGLTSIEIPNSVTSIGDYAFKSCIGLTSVIIPNSITSIGDYAFCGCRGLTSVEIPNSVTSIGRYAFYNCSGLTSIYSLNPTPPTAGYDDYFDIYCFDNRHFWYTTLYVLQNALEAYRTAEPWKNFKNIVGINPTWIYGHKRHR